MDDNNENKEAATPQKKLKLLIASMTDPTVAAAMDGLFRFATEEQAQVTLDKIARRFTLAKDSVPPGEDGKHSAIKLWVRDYDVTEEEREKGHRGNFAVVSVKRVAGGKYSLVAKKENVDIAYHPQKERPKSRHPNWGHPILRAVDTGKIFPNLKQAEKQLRMLHEQYPEVTIPGRDTLHALVYSRKGQGNPIQKIVIKIKLLQEGGVQLVLKGGKPKPQLTLQRPVPMPVSESEEAITDAQLEEEPQGQETEEVSVPEPEVQKAKAPAKKSGTTVVKKGKFTSLVEARRKKKKP